MALVVADHCWIPGFDAGYFGVDIFFVLSGFLITRLLVDEFDALGQIDLMKFYLRRLLRLAPPLMLMLAVYLAIAPVIWPQYGLGSHIRDVALAGLYLSDYGRAFWDAPTALQHTWSLSVEEHFYLIWPFAVLLLARIEPRWRIAGLFGLYLLVTAWRMYEYESQGWVATYFRADTRTAGLVCGALLEHVSRAWVEFRKIAANTVGVLACATLVVCLSLGFWRAPATLVWMASLGPDRSRGAVDLGLGTKLMGQPDIIGTAACRHRHHLIRHVFVALSYGRFFQGAASLVPDGPDRSDLCFRHGQHQLLDC